MTFRAGITISKSGAEHERKSNRNGAGLDRHGSAPASCEPLIRGAWGAGAPSAKLVKLDCKWTRSAAGPAETQVSDGAETDTGTWEVSETGPEKWPEGTLGAETNSDEEAPDD